MKTEQKMSKWTDWTEIDGTDMTGVMYKTNYKKVRVKVVGSDIVGESCCSKFDVFDLNFGIQMAYLRLIKKTWEKNKVDYINGVNEEIEAIETDIKEMIDSLYN